MTSYAINHRKQSTRQRRQNQLLRQTALITVPVLLLLAIVFLFWQQAVANNEAPPSVYVVQPGDSLWEIARQHAPEQMDVRVFVQQLRSLNGLKQSVIHTGQSLVLPVR